MAFIKALALVAGVAAGIVAATAAITAMYPDVSRRMTRDSKRMMRAKRMACGFLR